jgi:hypothetical protein
MGQAFPAAGTPVDHVADASGMSRGGSRLELACAWSGVAFLTTYLVFFLLVARWIPPHPPSWSAARVAELYSDHATRIRVGQVGAMFASFLLFPLWALISTHIARIEMAQKRMPILALIQFGCAVLLQVFFVLCSMLWIVAAFRAELTPETLRAIHDAGWLMFVMVAPGYLIQMVCIGAVAFIDKSSDPLIPRWAGYLHLWVGLSGLGGSLAVFFKEGPFAWNGAVGFYLPVAVFAVWLVVITSLLHRRAIGAKEFEPSRSK